MIFEENQIATITELSDAARRRSKELKESLGEAIRIEKFWTTLGEHMDRDWPLHVLSLMDENTELLTNLRKQSNDAIPHLVEIYKKVTTEAKEHRSRFPIELDNVFHEAGVEIDADSRHPKYYMRDKFFTLEINDKKQTARLSDMEGKLAEFLADVGAALEIFQKHDTRIFARKFNGKQFQLNKSVTISE